MSMISKIIPVNWLYGLLVGILLVSHAYVYKLGGTHFKTEYELKAFQERERIAIQIEKLNEAWEERLRLQEIEQDKLEQELKDLQDEAAKDPNAGRPSMSVDGVRRLNKIR